MSINLTITAESADEFRTLLNGFSALVSGVAVTGIPAGAPAPVEKAARTRKPVETTVVSDAQNDEPADTDDIEEPVTLEQLRAKATEVSQAGKQPEVKALLLKFEAKSVSTITEEQRPAFLKALEAL